MGVLSSSVVSRWISSRMEIKVEANYSSLGVQKILINFGILSRFNFLTGNNFDEIAAHTIL